MAIVGGLDILRGAKTASMASGLRFSGLAGDLPCCSLVLVDQPAGNSPPTDVRHRRAGDLGRDVLAAIR